MSLATTLFGSRHSLKRNLVVNIILAYVSSIALSSAILVYDFKESIRSNIETVLVREVQELAAQIDPNKPDLGFDPQALRIKGSEGTYRYTIFDTDRSLHLGGESSEAIRTQLAGLQPGKAEMLDMPLGRVGMALRKPVGQQDFYVLASTRAPGPDETGFAAFLDTFDEEYQWITVGIIAILLAALLTMRRALRPLVMISKQAHDIDIKASSRRLKTDKIPDEIIPIINAVNGAFDRLEQGYRSQRDFSSNVAHEVRTPLAVLRSSIELIQDPTLKAGLIEDAQRLNLLFEQLIDLSRAEALGPDSFKPVNMTQIATSLATELAPQTLRSGKTLAVTGAEECQVMGHAGLLTIALDNLVRNALAYSPRGSEIEIEVLCHPAGWKVYDQGPGVPDALRQSLFERFNRGAVSDPQRTGTGIGLAIVKSVADAHGAQVSITGRPEPGGGSIFTFEFNG